MMWGSRLTTDRLKHVIADIAETVHQIFPDVREIGIEFGQKIHHLCYDISINEIVSVPDDELRKFLTDEEFGELTDDKRHDLQKNIRRAAKLADILQDSKYNGIDFPKLTLLGFSARGSLKTRISFCEILKINHGLTPKYFVFQQWCEGYKELAERAAKIGNAHLAFHPFRFGPIDKCKQIDKQLRKIDKELENLPSVPQVQFVPDTAHLWLANEKIYRCDLNTSPNAIKWVFDTMLRRITAFHLKDWKKTFDSSLRYYSRGFTVLGGGYISSHLDGVEEAPLKSDLGRFCQRLQRNLEGDDQAGWDVEKERWVVFEQDFSNNDEKGTLQQSLEWFGHIVDGTPVPSSTEILPATQLFNENAPQTAEGVMPKKFDARKRQVINALHYQASHNSKQFATFLQDWCRYLFCGGRTESNAINDAEVRPVYVTLWEKSPRISTMVLLNKEETIGMGKPDDLLTAKRSYRVTNDTCTGFRVWKLSDLINPNDEQRVFFNAYSEEQWAKLFGTNSPVVAEAPRYDTVIWIPICNTYNYNQIEARLDIFVNSAELPTLKEISQEKDGEKDDSKEKFEFGRPGYQHKLEEYLDDLVRNIGSALEKVWGNAAYQTTSDLINKVDRAQTSDAMLKKLIDELTVHFDLKQGGCFYYELSKEEGTLHEYAPWSSNEIDEEFVECKGGNPGYQAKSDEDFWMEDIWGKDGKGKDKLERSWMAFPICAPTSREANEEKHSSVLGIIRCFRTNGISFTASDESTVSKMLADFVPLFLIRYVSERRMRSISFIRHELRSPLSAVNTTVENIVREVKNKGWEFHGNKDYGKEIGRYVSMMDSVLANSLFLTGQKITLNFDDQKVQLIKDIVMPAINQSLYLLFSDDKEESEIRREELAARRKISVFCNGYKRGDIVHSLHDEEERRRWNSILGKGPETLYIDAPRLFQVFFNLLVNAIKYRDETSGGGIEIYLNRLPYDDKSLYVNRAGMGPKGYVPEYDPTDWAVEILFCNDGLGIPENCNELIFGDGFRASNIRSRFTGDGLGLWVCREILRLHNNSKISLVWNGGKFTPGKPTMFRILLHNSLKKPPHQ